MKNLKVFLSGLVLISLLLSCSSDHNSDPAGEAESSYKRGMTMMTPSAQWREGLPSGNGLIGALVYGSIEEERVLFNHNELYYNGSFTFIPDMSEELPRVRRLLLEGKYAEANDLYPDKVREDMILTAEPDMMFEDYSRTLNFESGEVEVKWRDGDTRFSRRLFVSIPDDVSAMSITSDKGNAVSGTVTLDIHDLNDAVMRNGDRFNPGFTYETTVNDGFVEFRADGSGKGEFGGVMRVICNNGEMSESSASISFDDANEKGTIAVPRLKKKLAALKGDYTELFNRHKPIHNQKFSSMGVRLNMDGKRNTPNELLLLDAYQGPASIELLAGTSGKYA